MKDILQDIVAHTHSLGFIPLVKVTSDSNETKFTSLAEDRSVVLSAETNSAVEGFSGVFGMTNLDKLSLHLKNPEYATDAKISVEHNERNGETVPTHIHFENKAGDFQNDYRFMSKAIIEERLKDVMFKGAKWDIEFEPSVASIQRLKLMSAAHSEEPVFTVKVEDGNLKMYFGDISTHAGSFVFQHDCEGTLSHSWSYPVSQVQAILNLPGDIKMSISDAGAMKISVNSGLANYDYVLPAQSK